MPAVNRMDNWNLFEVSVWEFRSTISSRYKEVIIFFVEQVEEVSSNPF